MTIWMVRANNMRGFFDEAQKAANCIQCGECVPKCPQNIPISDWMPVIEDVLSNGQPYQKIP